MLNKNLRLLIFAVTITLVTAFSFFTFSGIPDILPDNLKKHVYKLSSYPKARNFRNLDILDSTGNYIKKVLFEDGYSVYRQAYLVNDTAEYYNLICHYGDTAKPRIVVGAHYDVCDEQPGADDNASGVAGLLELAGMLAQHKPALDYCIEMVFYTLEEPPFFRTPLMGSYIHAKSLYEKNTMVEAMISMEMIGFFSEEKNSQKFPVKILRLFYPDEGNFIAVVGKKGMRALARKFKNGINSGSGINAEMLIAPEGMKGIDFSDHLNYWLFGFKAIMITDTAFMRNPNYHKKSDKPETLNYVKMAEVVKGIYYSLINY